MLINEIEILGASLTVSVAVDCSELLANKLHALIADKGDEFNLEIEIPGFHDVDCESSLLRGFYSFVEPFEIEELVDGTTAKNLHKRIRSCEFITDGARLFAFGHQGARRLLFSAMSALSGTHFDLHKFEHNEMFQAGNRMTRLKSIVLINPKEKEVRLARLSGSIENYTDYNVIDSRNHGIKSISGLLDTPLGPMNVAIGEKGALRLGVKKGLIITFECLAWILDLVLGKHSGEAQSSHTCF